MWLCGLFVFGCVMLCGVFLLRVCFRDCAVLVGVVWFGSIVLVCCKVCACFV